ncbi:MAG: 30S ribosome-binding factor RbfA [Clostridiales bacterium]|nr:30S ribosome-binding factor RbfA [Clostridiales bacterium]
MPRIEKINDEIRNCLASLLLTVKDPRVSGLVTIVRVLATPDLKQARVYVSVLDDSSADDVIKGLKSASGFLRRELGRALRLRNTPELVFIRDESIKHGAHVIGLLQSMQAQSGSAEQDNNLKEPEDG